MAPPIKEDQPDQSQSITLAVLETKIEHISASISEMKELLKIVAHKPDLENIMEKVQKNEQDINRIKTVSVYVGAVSAIVSPIFLIVLTSLVERFFGS